MIDPHAIHRATYCIGESIDCRLRIAHSLSPHLQCTPVFILKKLNTFSYHIIIKSTSTCSKLSSILLLLGFSINVWIESYDILVWSYTVCVEGIFFLALINPPVYIRATAGRVHCVDIEPSTLSPICSFVMQFRLVLLS